MSRWSASSTPNWAAGREGERRPWLDKPHWRFHKIGRTEHEMTLNLWSPRVLSLVRIVAALLFMEHGLMKLAHFPAPQPGVPTPLPPLLVVAAVIEVIGGGLILVGLFTRAAAFIASGEMALGYFMAHAPKSFWPSINQGDAAILFCFVFLYLAFAGGGAWSLDRAVRKAE
jgi:putative oxidoreductase